MDFDALFQLVEQETKAPGRILNKMAEVESSYNPQAIGPETDYGRALGLMQILESNAQAAGIDPFDPMQSAMWAGQEFARNQQKFGGSVPAAVAAHHGGPNPEYWGKNTAAYVQKVLGDDAVAELDAQGLFRGNMGAPSPATEGFSVASPQETQQGSPELQSIVDRALADADKILKSLGLDGQQPARPTSQQPQPSFRIAGDPIDDPEFSMGEPESGPVNGPMFRIAGDPIDDPEFIASDAEPEPSGGLAPLFRIAGEPTQAPPEIAPEIQSKIDSMVESIGGVDPSAVPPTMFSSMEPPAGVPPVEVTPINEPAPIQRVGLPERINEVEDPFIMDEGFTRVQNPPGSTAGMWRDQLFTGFTERLRNSDQRGVTMASEDLAMMDRIDAGEFDNLSSHDFSPLGRVGKYSPQVEAYVMARESGNKEAMTAARDRVERRQLEEAEEQAERESIIRANPLPDAAQKAAGGTFAEFVEAVKENPSEALLPVVARSMGSFGPDMLWLLTGPWGAALGMGTGSFNLEQGFARAENLHKYVDDPTDPQQIIAALNDPEKRAEIVRDTTIGPAIVALFDSGSAGFAGKLINMAKTPTQKALAAAIELLVLQPGAGAAGEAGKQLYEHGEITHGGAVAMEAVAEPIAGGPMEIAPRVVFGQGQQQQTDEDPATDPATDEVIGEDETIEPDVIEVTEDQDIGPDTGADDRVNPDVPIPEDMRGQTVEIVDGDEVIARGRVAGMLSDDVVLLDTGEAAGLGTVRIVSQEEETQPDAGLPESLTQREEPSPLNPQGESIAERYARIADNGGPQTPDEQAVVDRFNEELGRARQEEPPAEDVTEQPDVPPSPLDAPPQGVPEASPEAPPQELSEAELAAFADTPEARNYRSIIAAGGPKNEAQSINVRSFERENEITPEIRQRVFDRENQAPAPEVPPASDRRRRNRGSERRRNRRLRERIEQLPPDARDLEIERLRRELDTDSLTGLGTKRSFNNDLPNAGAVVSGDLGSFKSVNDLMGHPAGDDVLAQIGEIARPELEAIGARGYRPGGDEFTITAPTIEAAQQAAAILQRAASLVRTRANGYTLEGVDMNIGIGTDYASADADLAKRKREQQGQRSEVSRGLVRDDGKEISASLKEEVERTDRPQSVENRVAGMGYEYDERGRLVINAGREQVLSALAAAGITEVPGIVYPDRSVIFTPNANRVLDALQGSNQQAEDIFSGEQESETIDSGTAQETPDNAPTWVADEGSPDVPFTPRVTINGSSSADALIQARSTRPGGFKNIPVRNLSSASPEAQRVLSRAVGDLLDAGFPRSVVERIDYFAVSDLRSTHKAAYYPLNNTVTIQETLLDQIAADPTNLRMQQVLRQHLAHEMTHSIDFDSSTRAYSHFSPLLSIDVATVLPDGTYINGEALGSVMAEMYTLHANNVHGLGRMLAYPFSGLESSVRSRDKGRIERIQSEVFAQAGALFSTMPDALKTSAPETYKLMQEVYRAASNNDRAKATDGVRKSLRSSRPGMGAGRPRGGRDGDADQGRAQEGQGGAGVGQGSRPPVGQDGRADTESPAEVSGDADVTKALAAEWLRRLKAGESVTFRDVRQAVERDFGRGLEVTPQIMRTARSRAESRFRASERDSAQALTRERKLTPKYRQWVDQQVAKTETAKAFEAAGLTRADLVTELERTLNLYNLLDPRSAFRAPDMSRVTIAVGERPKNGAPAKIKINWNSPFTFATDPKTGKQRTGKNRERMIERMSDQMADEIQSIQNKAMTGDATSQWIMSAKGWYSEYNNKARAVFGGFTDLFGQVLAATSPSTPVIQNYRESLEIIRRHARGEFDSVLSKYTDWATPLANLLAERASLDDRIEVAEKSEVAALRKKRAAVNAKITNYRRYDGPYPVSSTGKKYGPDPKGRLILSALSDNFVTRRGGDAPKVKNFYENLSGIAHRATIDSWAARTLQRIANGIEKGKHKTIGSAMEGRVDGSIRAADPQQASGSFGFGQEVFDAAAKKLTDRGIAVQPDDLQALVWFSEKNRWRGRTSAQGEGGSYEAEMVFEPVDRLSAGFSIQQAEEPPIELRRAVRKAIISKALSNDAVVAARLPDTIGRYKFGETDVVETSFDVELVVDQSWKTSDSVAFARSIIEQAKKNNQESVLLSRVVPVGYSSENGRTGMEITFTSPHNRGEMEHVVEFLRAAGVDGFTFVVDPRAQVEGLDKGFIGVRFQPVPEFGSSAIQPSVLNDIRTTIGEQFPIKAATVVEYDTLVVMREDYEKILTENARSGANARSDASRRLESWAGREFDSGPGRAVEGAFEPEGQAADNAQGSDVAQEIGGFGGGPPIPIRWRGSPPGAPNPAFVVNHESMTDAFLRRVQDKFRPVLRVQSAIRKTGKAISDVANAYLAETLFYGKTESDLRKLDRRFISPLINLMSQHNITQTELDLYLWARHAMERNRHIANINPNMPDGGSGMTNLEAQRILRLIKNDPRFVHFRTASTIVYKMLATQRGIIRRNGLETQDMIDTWEAAYTNYIPLKGYAADQFSNEIPRIGKGFSISGRESMRAMGRRSIPSSPLANAIADATNVIVRARKNEVGNSFLKLVEDNPNPDYWQIFTDNNPEMTRRIVRRVGHVQTGNGQVVRIPYEEVVNEPVPMSMMKDHYFTTKRGGQTYYIKLADERLMRALKNLGPEHSNVVIKTLAHVNRYLSTINTSLNPEFMISNAIRDFQTALYNIAAEASLPGGRAQGVSAWKMAAQMAKDWRVARRAVYRVLRDSSKGVTSTYNGQTTDWIAEAREYMDIGAKTGYFDSKNVDEQVRDIQKKLMRARRNPAAALARGAESTLQLIDDINGGVENAVRLAAYVNAKRAGLSPTKAADLAKNLTVNFNRKGEIGNSLNALWVFANASIQGTANFARAILTPAIEQQVINNQIVKKYRLNNAQKAALVMVAGAAALSLLNASMAGEDDDGVNWYDKIPDWVRERNLVIMKSIWGGPEGEYIALPLPYGYNTLHVLGDVSASVGRHYTGDGGMGPGEGAVRLSMSLLGSFNPLGSEGSEQGAHVAILKNLLPTLGRPLLALGINENYFGGPIYRENYPFGTPKPDSHLFFRSTKEHWKHITQFVNDLTGGSQFRSGDVDVSPDTLNYLFEFGTGAAGAFIGRTANFAVKMAEPGDRVPEGGLLKEIQGRLSGMEAREVPFIRKVMGRVTPYEDQSKFYDRYDTIMQFESEYKALDDEQAAAFEKRYGPMVDLAPVAKQTRSYLSEMRKERTAVETAEDSTAAEKDREIEEIEKEMKAAVDDFNRQFLEVQKAGPRK